MLELKSIYTNTSQEQPIDLRGLANPRTSQQRLTDALNQPPIKNLLGEIWMSGELHLLFADTGVGKSIFAVTIGNALSKGRVLCT
jgi:RecA-family ATPase